MCSFSNSLDFQSIGFSCFLYFYSYAKDLYEKITRRDYKKDYMKNVLLDLNLCSHGVVLDLEM